MTCPYFATDCPDDCCQRQRCEDLRRSVRAQDRAGFLHYTAHLPLRAHFVEDGEGGEQQQRAVT